MDAPDARMAAVEIVFLHVLQPVLQVAVGDVLILVVRAVLQVVIRVVQPNAMVRVLVL